LMSAGSPETEAGGAKRAMSRSVTLEMDAFGVEAFTELAERQGGSASGLLRMAAHYYLADSDDGRPAWQVPSFAHEAAPEPRRAGVQVEVDDETWDALVEEARRQGVDVGVLAAHAVLYFMADVDSGRVAQRMGDSVTERPGS
jgi:DNA-binding transcriptional LysR family regulator